MAETKKAKIIRFKHTNQGTLGILYFENHGINTVLPVIERPWVNNERSFSCIPDSVYIVQRVKSPHFGDTFEVMDVPNRTDILFHKGNTIKDSKGCILVGNAFGMLNDKLAVVGSRAGFERFMDTLKDDDKFVLEIKWDCSKIIY